MWQWILMWKGRLVPSGRSWKGHARRSYYDSLWAQFRSLPEVIVNENPLVVEKIHKLFEATDRYSARWRDLAAIELLLAQLDPAAGAAYRAGLTRQRLRYFLSAEDYTALAECSATSGLESATVSDVQSQLRSLVSLFHLQMDLRLKRNALRDLLGIWSIAIALVVLLAGLAFARCDYHSVEREDSPRTLPAGKRNLNPVMNAPAEKAPEVAPSDLLVSAGGGRVNLVWDDNTTNEEEFRIERKVGDEQWTVLDRIPKDVVSLEDRDVLPGNRYSYRILAANSKGMSLASEPVTVTTRVYGTREEFPVFLFVLLMGALGGFVGLQRRLQQTAPTGHLLSGTMDLESGKLTAGAAPLFGAVFALLLYLVFAAGFLEGEFFPKIYPVAAAVPFLPRTGVTSMGEFLLLSHPVSPIDVAKLLVWSFVAGFAERLVPDTLDRIANRADNTSPPVITRDTQPSGGSTTDQSKGAVLADEVSAKAPETGAGVETAPMAPQGDAETMATSLILDITPGANEETSPDVTPKIRFTVPMQEVDLMLLQLGEEPIEVAQSYSEDRRTLTLTPLQSLAPGKYELRISTLFPVGKPEEEHESATPFTVA